MSTTAILVTGLIKRYGVVKAVDGLDLEVPHGTVAALLGPNGAGKTTTVECCEGYRRPDQGRVAVLGLDPVADGGRLHPRIGVMLQAGGIPPAVRAGEMLRHMARFYRHPVDPALLIERLALSAALKTQYRRLSGGQQQRLALALIGRPELVFLDEPTAGLDPQGRRATWELVAELKASGVTVLLTTHAMEDAERLADLVFIIDHGRLKAEGSVQEITSRAGSVARFAASHPIPPEELEGALPGALKVAFAGNRYEVTGNVGPQVIAALDAWCAARGVSVEGLEIRRRGLEDVYLDLTGREQRGG